MITPSRGAPQSGISSSFGRRREGALSGSGLGVLDVLDERAPSPDRTLRFTRTRSPGNQDLGATTQSGDSVFPPSVPGSESVWEHSASKGCGQ